MAESFPLVPSGLLIREGSRAPVVGDGLIVKQVDPGPVTMAFEAIGGGGGGVIDGIPDPVSNQNVIAQRTLPTTIEGAAYRMQGSITFNRVLINATGVPTASIMIGIYQNAGGDAATPATPVPRVMLIQGFSPVVGLNTITVVQTTIEAGIFYMITGRDGGGVTVSLDGYQGNANSVQSGLGLPSEVVPQLFRDTTISASAPPTTLDLSAVTAFTNNQALALRFYTA